jgi:hypothetical protein
MEKWLAGVIIMKAAKGYSTGHFSKIVFFLLCVCSLRYTLQLQNNDNASPPLQRDHQIMNICGAKSDTRGMIFR